MSLRMRRLLLDSVAALRHEPHPWRVRALLHGAPVVDSTTAVLVWEPRRLVPVFAVPRGDVRAELRGADPAVADPVDLPPMLGPEHFEWHTTPGRSLDVLAGPSTLQRAAFAPDDPDLAGLVLLDFAAFDRWLEEEQELVGHPHDPYKRIDTARSDRHVVVSFEGEVLADTTRAVALHETHLPVRWYVPREDVRMDRLEPSATRTTCAYKGHAAYLSVTGAGPAGTDVAWTYPDPLRDALAVADMICFWAERTDLRLDDAALRRPVTPWSSRRELSATGPEEWEAG